MTWEGQLMCGIDPTPVSASNGDNGFGNGDQDAPGNSLDNNNAENSDRDPPPGQ